MHACVGVGVGRWVGCTCVFVFVFYSTGRAQTGVSGPALSGERTDTDVVNTLRRVEDDPGMYVCVCVLARC